MTEEQLIQECIKGNNKAHKLLYERFAVKMFRLCYRYIRHECDAEEVLINGFVKVFEHIPNFENRGSHSLESWIKRIMINESLMFLRRNHNFNLVSDSKAEFVEAEYTLDMNMGAEEIYALILELPVGYRTVFNLYVIEGYAHKEIALQLGISENTSKSQLSKARGLLKKMLIKNGISYGT